MDSLQNTTSTSTNSTITTPLALPSPHDSTDSQDSTKAQQNVHVNGDVLKLDALGPMVVNSDGTLSRISNWTEMSELEKKNTLRVLSKRNKERLEMLKKTMDQLDSNPQ